MSEGRRLPRRSILAGVLAATGLAGTGLAAKLAPRLGESDEAQQSTNAASIAGRWSEVLYLDRYAVFNSGGVQRRRGDQTVLRATLLTADGEKAGELFAAAVTMPGPIDEGSPQTPRMEMQSLHLREGTLLAMGTVFTHPEIPNIYTIVGGTGRFAGVRGTYRFDEDPTVASVEAQATIRLDLAT